MFHSILPAGRGRFHAYDVKNLFLRRKEKGRKGSTLSCRYRLEVKRVERAVRAPSGSVDALKGVVSGKMIARMKKEVVNCPVYGRTLAFLECFICPNFVRRLKGEVHCKGDALNNPPKE